MAKPILVVRCNIISDVYKLIQRNLEAKMPDYHVILISSSIYDSDNFIFETYNDVSGLKDTDITELLNEIKSQIHGES